MKFCSPGRQRAGFGREEARFCRKRGASGWPRFFSTLLLLGVLAVFSARCGGPSLAADGPAAGTGANVAADGLIASPEPGWPQWRGPRRDGISDEIGLLPTWPEDGPRLLWKVDGLGQGWSSPIVVQERVYVTGDVADDLIVFAFDLGSKLLWQAKNGAAWQGSFRSE